MNQEYILPLIIGLIIGGVAGYLISLGGAGGDKALITSQQPYFYINEYDESEIFYVFSVYNYGYSEAKSVSVACRVYDGGADGLSENLLDSKDKNIGNIASTSVKHVEIASQNPGIDESKYYTLYCYVESCDNCEIVDRRIPELTEELERIM